MSSYVIPPQVEEVPPVPPFEVQAAEAKRYSTGGETVSVAVSAVISIVETPVFAGAERNCMGLGSGGVVS